MQKFISEDTTVVTEFTTEFFQLAMSKQVKCEKIQHGGGAGGEIFFLTEFSALIKNAFKNIISPGP